MSDEDRDISPSPSSLVRYRQPQPLILPRGSPPANNEAANMPVASQPLIDDDPDGLTDGAINVPVSAGQETQDNDDSAPPNSPGAFLDLHGNDLPNGINQAPGYDYMDTNSSGIANWPVNEFANPSGIANRPVNEFANPSGIANRPVNEFANPSGIANRPVNEFANPSSGTLNGTNQTSFSQPSYGGQPLQNTSGQVASSTDYVATPAEQGQDDQFESRFAENNNFQETELSGGIASNTFEGNAQNNTGHLGSSQSRPNNAYEAHMSTIGTPQEIQLLHDIANGILQGNGPNGTEYQGSSQNQFNQFQSRLAGSNGTGHLGPSPNPSNQFQSHFVRRDGVHETQNSSNMARTIFEENGPNGAGYQGSSQSSFNQFQSRLAGSNGTGHLSPSPNPSNQFQSHVVGRNGIQQNQFLYMAPNIIPHSGQNGAGHLGPSQNNNHSAGRSLRGGARGAANRGGGNHFSQPNTMEYNLHQQSNLINGANHTLTNGAHNTLTHGANYTLTNGAHNTLAHGGSHILTNGANYTLTNGVHNTLTHGANYTLTNGAHNTWANGNVHPMGFNTSTYSDNHALTNGNDHPIGFETSNYGDNNSSDYDAPDLPEHNNQGRGGNSRSTTRGRGSRAHHVRRNARAENIYVPAAPSSRRRTNRQRRAARNNDAPQESRDDDAQRESRDDDAHRQSRENDVHREYLLNSVTSTGNGARQRRAAANRISRELYRIVNLIRDGPVDLSENDQRFLRSHFALGHNTFNPELVRTILRNVSDVRIFLRRELIQWLSRNDHREVLREMLTSEVSRFAAANVANQGSVTMSLEEQQYYNDCEDMLQLGGINMPQSEVSSAQSEAAIPQSVVPQFGTAMAQSELYMQEASGHDDYVNPMGQFEATVPQSELHMQEASGHDDYVNPTGQFEATVPQSEASMAQSELHMQEAPGYDDYMDPMDALNDASINDDYMDPMDALNDASINDDYMDPMDALNDASINDNEDATHGI